jgi:phosphatidylglycerol:prolipoprotein diacylglycerol transferase
MISNQIEVGPVTVHLYGLIIGLGVLAALRVSLAVVGVKQSHLVKETVMEATWWALLAGLVAARLYHVVDLWDYYRTDWMKIPQIWYGGLSIVGGVMGGAAGLWGYARKHKLAWMELVDVAAVGLPLAQAMGRWGNFVNQELYGLPTQVPWALFVPMEKRLAGYENVSRYHPLFLYESGLNLLLFGGLWWLMKKVNLGEGKLFGGYLIGYGLIRFSLEGLRIESFWWQGMRVAQLFGILSVGAGVLLWKRSDALKTKHEKDG